MNELGIADSFLTAKMIHHKNLAKILIGMRTNCANDFWHSVFLSCISHGSCRLGSVHRD